MKEIAKRANWSKIESEIEGPANRSVSQYSYVLKSKNQTEIGKITILSQLNEE